MTSEQSGETWRKESNVTDDDVTWYVITTLTGHEVAVAECQFEQFADMIIADHAAAQRETTDESEREQIADAAYMKGYADGKATELADVDFWTQQAADMAKERNAERAVAGVRLMSLEQAYDAMARLEAQRDAESERADRAERELESEERNASYHLGRWQKAIAERDALRRTVQSLSDVSAEQVTELADERAAAAALAKEAETVVRIVKEKWGSANEFPAFNRALAAYRATHQPATEAQA